MTETKRYRLLVVDDEEDLRIILNQVLTKEGYEIVTANDGDEAVRLLQEGTFDATLLDILMPHRNGMSVLKYITENHPSTKTIMLTGYADLERAMEAKKNGAADFISKPYKLQTILSTLERVLK